MNFQSFGRLIDNVTGLFCDGNNLNLEQFGQQMDSNQNVVDFGNFEVENDEDYQFRARPVQPKRQVNAPVQKPKKRRTGVYKFLVGVRPLNASFDSIGNALFSLIGGSHACFLLDSDIFEYGTHDDGNDGSYVRHRNVGKTEEFDWDYLGEALHGTTYVSPDELEEGIIRNGSWVGSKYKFTRPIDDSHNCHDFVQFCIKYCCGDDNRIAQKAHSIFVRQDKHNALRGALFTYFEEL